MREGVALTNKGYKVFVYDSINGMRGLNAEIKEKLQAAGIKYMQQLLERGKTEQQRIEFAQRVDLPLSTIQCLVGRADVMRLRSIGGDLSHLLEFADVTSCRILQQQQPEVLYKRLAEIHIGKKIGYHAPSLAQVRSWINEAKELARSSPE